jgi:hypothetical protein
MTNVTFHTVDCCRLQCYLYLLGHAGLFKYFLDITVRRSLHGALLSRRLL